jgi:hypothetical protein
MNDEVKTNSSYFIVHRSYFIVSNACLVARLVSMTLEGEFD